MSDSEKDVNMSQLDAYSPDRIAQLVDEIGIKKANQSFANLFVLGFLAGIFIAFGAMLYTLVITDSNLGYGLTRLFGGIAFSLGLVLVVVAGAELFTGNNLIVMAWANKDISSRRLFINWTIVYIANFVGALASAYAMHWSGLLEQNNGMIRTMALSITEIKVNTNSWQLFIRGILCNALVCLAIWLCIAAHDVASKVIAIVFPISAFVALGFEHSIANMYFIPLGMIVDSGNFSISDLLHNILPVTVGNIIGGSVFVALIYWIVYLRK